jgi:hypothetical protein
MTVTNPFVWDSVPAKIRVAVETAEPNRKGFLVCCVPGYSKYFDLALVRLARENKLTHKQLADTLLSCVSEDFCGYAFLSRWSKS